MGVVFLALGSWVLIDSYCKQCEAHRWIVDPTERSQASDLRRRPMCTEVAKVLKKIEGHQAKPTGTNELEMEQKRHEDYSQ